MTFMVSELNRLAAASVGQTVTAHGATFAVGLSTSTPTSTATNITEPSGNGYARASITQAQFTAPAVGATANSAVVTFPQASGAGWGTVTHAVVYNTAGTAVWFAPLAASQAIPANVTFSIPVGQLTNTIS